MITFQYVNIRPDANFVSLFEVATEMYESFDYWSFKILDEIPTQDHYFRTTVVLFLMKLLVYMYNFRSVGFSETPERFVSHLKVSI